MSPSDTALNQLLLNLTVLGVQAATAFSQAQDRLGLQHVLDADRMTSPRGLAQSREAVQQLLALMAQYKAVHAQLITGATSQWVAAMEGMPEGSRAALQQHFTQAINQNLQDQARLYDYRERWIAAVTQALDLVEANPGAFWMEGDELVCARGALLDDLCALVDVMDEVRAQEVALFEERQAGAMAAMARMNASS